MLNVLSLFSGIGAFEKALRNKNIPYNLLAYCEIETKYASKAYSAIHNEPESKNLIDVTQVDILDIDDPVDLITYGFPCQDISVAGKTKGFTDENGELTRSGLFFEALRIIEAYRPKFAIAENVKNLTGKKFKAEFATVLESLEQAGYMNYWAVLNAKNYGVPQNRERVFIVSIRKDIDTGCKFPEPIPLELRLKDILDDEVDEKYYLTDERVLKLIEHKTRNTEKGNGFGAVFKNEDEIASCVLTSPDKLPGQYLEVPYSKDNLAEWYKAKLNTAIAGLSPEDVLSADYRYDEGVRVREDGLSPTLTTKGTGFSGRPLTIGFDEDSVRIRKLTPWECFKLMGFTKEDCDKALSVASESQVYKMAGNSIVVKVLEHLYESLGEIYSEFRGVQE